MLMKLEAQVQNRRHHLFLIDNFLPLESTKGHSTATKPRLSNEKLDGFKVDKFNKINI